MSGRFDYVMSQKVSRLNAPFDALIMAAMQQADAENGLKLRAAFPDLHDELTARYQAPGGWLPGERSSR